MLTISGITLNPKSEEGVDYEKIELPQDEMFDFGGLNPFSDVTAMEGPELHVDNFHATQLEILTIRQKEKSRN